MRQVQFGRNELMAAKSTDIFESDEAFLETASVVLLVLGISALVFVLLCKGFHWGFCDLKWVPLFGGFDLFRADLAAINLPLALLILGIGLRLQTGFGWSTCVILLWALASIFSFMAYWLWGQLGEYYQQLEGQQIVAKDYPIVESIAVNVGFSILSLLGIIYLMLPSVRKLYWKRRVAQSLDSSEND